MPRARIDIEAIELAALSLGDDGGLEAITARSLAERLGVTPMALYRHVPSIGAVTDALFERVIAKGALTNHATVALSPWLVETFSRIRTTLLAHPCVLPLAGTPAGYGPVALGFVDTVLGRLCASGISEADAARVFHALLAYTLGATSLEVAARRAGVSRTKRGSIKSSNIALADLPHVRASLGALVHIGSESSFRDGLERIAAAMLPDAHMGADDNVSRRMR